MRNMASFQVYFPWQETKPSNRANSSHRFERPDLLHFSLNVSFLMVLRSDHLPTISAEQLHEERSMCSSLINKCRDNDSLEGHQDRENNIFKNLLAKTDINKDGQHIPTSSHMKPKHPEQRFCHLVPVKWVGPGLGSLKDPKEPNRDRDFLCGIKWCPF